MVRVENLIAGAGIAGLGLGQRLHEMNKEYYIIEKNSEVGGLCSSFEIDRFIFDYFIHLSFTSNPIVRGFFDDISYIKHVPNPCNYYHGIWIKHPAISNLYPLSDEEKKRILVGLECRERYKKESKDSYEKWLRYQYGDYYSEHFPLVYTRKYWCEEANRMGTEWIGERVYQPSIEEIIEGMRTEDTPVSYYAKEMRYPENGGFKSFLKGVTQPQNISLDEEVIEIDLKERIVTTNKDSYCYNRLYSSIPITELKRIIVNDNSEKYIDLCKASGQLRWTGAYLVSLGLKGVCPRKDLWDYVYDEEIAISRLYFPSLMAPSSAPYNCFSVQAEIYTMNGNRNERSDEELLDETISQLNNIGIIDPADIIVKDIRFWKYCNILFDHNIYKNRDCIMNYLKCNGLIPIGRFGKWDYLWSDQSFMSGYNAALE